MSKHWYVSPEILKSLPSHQSRAIFLYIAISGTVKGTISDLAEIHSCTRRTMTTALADLLDRGLLVVSGVGYVRTFSVPEKHPSASRQPAICAQGAHMLPESTLTELMCAQGAHLCSEIGLGKHMCAQRAHIEPNSDATSEGHTLLGTLSTTTTMAPPSPPSDGREGALNALKGIWNELFCFLGKEPYGEHLERLISHWEITRKTTGHYPTKKELAAAFDWVKSKSYSKTVGSILAAFAAVREGEKSNERPEARKPRGERPAEAAKPTPTAAPADQKYYPIPKESPWSRYQIPVIPNDGSYAFKTRAWTPPDQLPGDLTELLYEQDTKNGWRTDCLFDYSQAPGLREIAVAAGYHG